eukprot:10770143-Ditylum_brightwellii.AAC.1
MVNYNPQAVHPTFGRLLQHKWSCLQQLSETNLVNYNKLDNIIKSELALSLLDVNIVDNSILSLSSPLFKFTGMCMLQPSTGQPLSCATSLKNTAHLKDAILKGEGR